ncbi:hypothetical protein BH23VER1_BH23VER1_26500 [soil metagenome]
MIARAVYHSPDARYYQHHAPGARQFPRPGHRRGGLAPTPGTMLAASMSDYYGRRVVIP